MPEQMQHSEITSQEAHDSPLKKSPPPSDWIIRWISWTASSQFNLKVDMEILSRLALCCVSLFTSSTAPFQSELLTAIFSLKNSFKRKFTRKGKMWLKNQEECLQIN